MIRCLWVDFRRRSPGLPIHSGRNRHPTGTYTGGPAVRILMTDLYPPEFDFFFTVHPFSSVNFFAFFRFYCRFYFRLYCRFCLPFCWPQLPCYKH